jgi:hypothetical protein
MPFNFRIEQLNESDYQLTISYETKKGQMERFFNLASKKLKRKKGIEVEGDLNAIEQFQIPEEKKNIMLPIIKQGIRKNVAEVRKIVKEDGFEMLSWDVVDVIYKRKRGSDTWLIDVIIKGVCSKKETK